MLNIKILGTGCPNCKRLEAETRKAVEILDIAAEFSKISDYREIMEYDILSTPGLVINEKLVSSGKIPSRAELTRLITSALADS
jgi:small redox-active disulfide protein 2